MFLCVILFSGLRCVLFNFLGVNRGKMVGRPEAWRCSGLKLAAVPIQDWPIQLPTPAARRNLAATGFPLNIYIYKVFKKEIQKLGVIIGLAM